MKQFKYFIQDSSDAPLENEYFGWAREQFGNIGDRWTANFQGFWFDREDDVALFILRWGNNKNLRPVEVNF